MKAERQWLDEETAGEAAQLTALVNSMPELVLVGVVQRR
jgi:hypothetical protein